MAQQRRLDGQGQEIPPDLPGGGPQGPMGGPATPAPQLPGAMPPVDPGPGGGLPPGPADDPSRGSETPRERQPDVGLRGVNATPPRPNVPTPMAGSVSNGPQEPTLNPFSPMGGPSPVSMATPHLRGLYGGAGGLTGGGLGVPNDPTSNDASNPISSLIKSLMGQMGQRG